MQYFALRDLIGSWGSSKRNSAIFGRGKGKVGSKLYYLFNYTMRVFRIKLSLKMYRGLMPKYWSRYKEQFSGQVTCWLKVLFKTKGRVEGHRLYSSRPFWNTGEGVEWTRFLLLYQRVRELLVHSTPLPYSRTSRSPLPTAYITCSPASCPRSWVKSPAIKLYSPWWWFTEMMTSSPVHSVQI